jgi:four helix bundle protein
MAFPESFQDRGFRFALEILTFHRKVLASRTPSHIAYQLMRAGTSIGANLEEAKSAYSRRDLASKYTIALREARECHYWLRLIKADTNDAPPQIERLLDDCNQIIAVLTTAVRSLRAMPSPRIPPDLRQT